MKQDLPDSLIVAMPSDLAVQVVALGEISQREAVEKEITRVRNYFDAGQKEEANEIAKSFQKYVRHLILGVSNVQLILYDILLYAIVVFLLGFVRA